MIRGKFATHRITVKGDVLNLEASLKVVNHSPTGFAWGYGGSGPAQLALALQFVARLPQADFEIPARYIEEWIRQRQVGWEDDGPSQEYDDDMLTGGTEE